MRMARAASGFWMLVLVLSAGGCLPFQTTRVNTIDPVGTGGPKAPTIQTTSGVDSHGAAPVPFTTAVSGSAPTTMPGTFPLPKSDEYAPAKPGPSIPDVPVKQSSAVNQIGKWPFMEPPATNTPKTPTFSPMADKGVGLPKAEPPKDPFVVALECMLQNRHQEALTHLHAYDPETRELLLRLLSTLSLFSKKKVVELTPAEIAVFEDSLAAIRNVVLPHAELGISKLVFCESIKGYAFYKPLPESHLFLAARGDRPGELVQLYVEMKNLNSRPANGLYETDLASTVEVFDEAGQRRWVHRFRPDELTLVSRLRLGNYYHNFSFFLPSCLTPGKYHLTVTLIDQTNPESPRTTTASTPLTVVAER
jgi:hypothetical protein